MRQIQIDDFLLYNADKLRYFRPTREKITAQAAIRASSSRAKNFYGYH